MIVKVDCGGVMVAFGMPGNARQAEPFYPYLQEIEPIAEANNEESGSAVFILNLKAKELIDLNMRRAVVIYDDSLEAIFQGVIARVAYSNIIKITVEA